MPTPKQDDYTERLMKLIEQDHEVIAKNASAFEKLTAAVEGMQNALNQMQIALNLLVGQITTSISQRNEGVPVRVFLIVVIVMAAFSLSLIGLAAADLIKLGGIP
jgi:hypothetical protein